MNNSIHTKLIWAAVVAAAVTMASCTFETSGNGDFDGFWHLQKVDSTQTGGSTDLSAKRIFWAVQAKLLNVTDKDNSTNSFLLRFDRSGNTLRTYSPHENNRPEGDPEVDDPTRLYPFGINALDDTFHIEKLTGTRMILTTKKLKLTFRKF